MVLFAMSAQDTSGCRKTLKHNITLIREISSGSTYRFVLVVFCLHLHIAHFAIGLVKTHQTNTFEHNKYV